MSRPVVSERPTSPPGAGIEARLEAAVAAHEAGASETAIASLRAAVAEARDLGDRELQGRALLALGSALVHNVRGRDGEGAGILYQAIRVAGGTKTDALVAQAHRELGYVEMLRGRYERSQRWLRQAASLAVERPAEAAWAHAVEGVALTDAGRQGEALDALGRALRLGGEAGGGAVEAWAWTFIGRSHLLRGELPYARHALEQGLAVARRLRWTSFIPLPEALLADVDLAEGRIPTSRAEGTSTPTSSRCSSAIHAGRGSPHGASVS